ncbi:MAG: tetratricopeptide repeat protein [Oligoflexia bacterium]|nr:tetratricopeptide repeat protein [Oligoflexia bacterium]
MSQPSLPPQVRAALCRGRQAYLRRAYDQARVEDQQALSLAERLGSKHGQVRALRLLGLCTYRTGQVEESRDYLDRALSLAEEIGWHDEALLVCNHLGATLRKLGQLDRADQVFREALSRATPKEHLAARARLCGSYGAFLDDLGQAQAAAEHYARYEELLGMLDDPGRLANARGLMSRACRLRGDIATAEAKAREECLLGARTGQPLREGRGFKHLAQALAARGDAAGAERAFNSARQLLDGSGDVRTPIQLATALGSFYLDQGRIHDAHSQVQLALSHLDHLSDSEHEHRASVSLLAAQVGSAAGLHGEAFWHMANALESQIKRFEPISGSALREITEHRRQQIIDLAGELLHEAGVVDRDQAERKRIDELVDRLHGEAPKRPPPPAEAVEQWRSRVRAHARERWRRLLPDSFDHLADGSRSDLLLADMVSQGPVDDLPRSLFLMFATIERELRTRVIDPLRSGSGSQAEGSKLAKLLSNRQKGAPGLGTLVTVLRQHPGDLPPNDPLCRFRRLANSAPVVEALGVLRQDLTGVDGRHVDSPLKQRNAIAHGRLIALGRTDADAVRRVLTLGAKAVLMAVMSLVPS